ncbi:hypothetical protein [Thiomonas intermedia]|uniref:hypothetical protein n=1 Tax=Thiomonas intermedia TaxID=926 RepID=UPI0009A4BCA8|nr:hypothetical protein [Thiomonas intermedia]
MMGVDSLKLQPDSRVQYLNSFDSMDEFDFYSQSALITSGANNPELFELGQLVAEQGYALPSATIERAVELLENLVCFSNQYKGEWLPAHITVPSDGELSFEWWRGQRKLTIYVSSHAAEYIKVWGPHIDTEMEDGILNSGGDLVKIWLWLFS